jgi:hypothetical protein
MNLIRCIFSVLFVVLLAVSVAGWIWAGGLAPASQAGARVVLAACGLSAVGGLVLLWKAKRPGHAE